MKTIYDTIKETVLENIIKKAGSHPGESLHDVNLNVMQIREVLYSTLKDLEIKEVEDKWQEH